MPPTHFPLQSVQQLREAERDRHRRQLEAARCGEAESRAAVEQIQDQLDQLAQTLRNAVHPGVLEIGELQLLKERQQTLRKQLDQSRQQREDRRAESERRRLALTQADRQVRVLERLAERYQQRRAARNTACPS